jgi:hypothetical protein
MIKRSEPGYPSQVGSKPGDDFISTNQLVASRGRVGSNPTPGAFLAQFLPVSCWFSAFFAHSTYCTIGSKTHICL